MAVVVIKAIPAIGSYVEILLTVIVVITRSNSHAVAGALQTGFLCDVFELPLRRLVKQPIPILCAGLLRNRALGSGIRKRSPIDQENVETPIAVTIKQGDTRPHCLDQILSGRMRSLMRKMNPRSGRDIHELPGYLNSGRRGRDGTLLRARRKR